MNKLLPLSILFLLAACQPKIDYDIKELPITGLADTVSVVAAGDLIGNSKDELILGKDSTISIYQIENDSAEIIYSSVLTDKVLLLKTGDVDEDGVNDLVAITGDKRYKETEVRVFLIQYKDKKWQTLEIYSKFSTRPHATNLILANYPDQDKQSIIISYFESKYLVETAVLTLKNESWETEIIEVKRMAMAKDVGELPSESGKGKSIEMVVGRVYGDEIGMLGDAYILGEETFLPSKRGVKSAKIGDGDNDGENEIYFGDGWHQDYGKIARGRLAEINILDSEYSYELIEDVKFQYEITQIDIADINRDGLNEILAKGNKFTRIYQKDEEGWRVFSDSLLPAQQYCIGDVSGDKHPELIFSGSEVKVFNLGNIEFSSELGEEVVTKKVFPDSLIGNPAPELSMEKWLNGSFPGLYNSKGKVVLLDFWATWCKPCIRTFPEMERLQKTYGPEGLQILGLTRLDNRQSVEDIEEFVENQNFIYPIGISNESLNNLIYGVGGIPHVVLIDKQSIVRWYKVGAGDTSELEEMIKELISE